MSGTATKQQRSLELSSICYRLKQFSQRDLLDWVTDEMDKSTQFKKLLTSQYKITQKTRRPGY